MSGWSVLGMISLIREKYGDTGLSRFRQNLPAYAAAIMEKKILAGKWYPYSLVGDFAKTAQHCFGSQEQDIIEWLGLHGGAHAVNELFTIYKHVNNSGRRIIESTVRLWDRYFIEAGRNQVISLSVRPRGWVKPLALRRRLQEVCGILAR